MWVAGGCRGPVWWRSGVVTPRSRWLRHHWEHPKTAACQGSPRHLCSDIAKESSCWGRRHAGKRRLLRKKRKQNGGDMWKTSPLGTWLETRSWKEVFPDKGGTPPQDWGHSTPGQVQPWGTAAMGDRHWCRGKHVRSSRTPLGQWPQPAVPPVTLQRGLGGCGNTHGDGGGWDCKGGGEESDWSQAWARGRKGVSPSVHLIVFFFSILDSVIKSLC